MCTAVSFPLLYYAVKAPWDRIGVSGTSEIAFLESTRIVTVFYAQATHKKEKSNTSVFSYSTQILSAVFSSPLITARVQTSLTV